MAATSNSSKVHSLTGQITLSLVAEAYTNVKRNKGAAGIDKVSLHMFEQQLGQNLLALARELKKGTFQPLPLRRVYIPKEPGKQRPLGIPAVRDRVAQEVLRLLLNPHFEPRFHQDSYGFRPGRNCHMAIETLLELHRQGHVHVLDADIQGFFDNIPHPVIMAGLRAVVADGNILNLIEKFLTSGVMEAGQWRPTSIGTPQGGVISPLLANIALDFLDWHLDSLGYRFVRYADDFVVVCSTATQAQEALTAVQHRLKELGLTLSPTKTRITTFTEGYTFLGFEISARSVRMRPKAVEKFKTKVRDVTRRSRNLDAEALTRLNRIVRGTANYFAAPFASCVNLFRGLDRWLRMRLRCMKSKRKSRQDNWRIRLRHLRHWGAHWLSDFLPQPCR
jgi:group II intron reverse transcriptase/maturase